ncbi:hypothetical protein NKH77_55020 [Streptomyces sp. M19]
MLAYVLSGEVDPAALRAALDDATVRHPALRTVYPWPGELPEQRVVDGDAARVPFETVPRPAGGAPPRSRGRSPPTGGGGRSTWRRSCRSGPGCANWAHGGICCASRSTTSPSTAGRSRCSSRTWGPVRAARGWRAPEGLPPVAGYADHGRHEDRHTARLLRAELPFWRRRLESVPPPVLPAPAGDGEARRAETVTRVAPDVVERLGRAAGARAGRWWRAGRGRRPRPGPYLRRPGCDGGDRDRRPVLRRGGADRGLLRQSAGGAGARARELADAALLERVAGSVVSALEHGRVPFDALVRHLSPPRERHPWFQAWSVLQKRRRTACSPRGSRWSPYGCPLRRRRWS